MAEMPTYGAVMFSPFCRKSLALTAEQKTTGGARIEQVFVGSRQ